MVVAEKRLSLEEFLRLPEEEPALEYEDGRIVQKVSPQGRHSALQGGLVQLFNRHLPRRKLVRAFPELRTTYAGTSTVPDVAVYRWDRIPTDERGQVADTVTDPPDIAIEIASPGQSTNALVRRCLWYVANGVPVSLLVDPDDRSIAVFRHGRAPEVRRGSEKIDLDDVVPDLNLTPRQVFAALRAR